MSFRSSLGCSFPEEISLDAMKQSLILQINGGYIKGLPELDTQEYTVKCNQPGRLFFSLLTLFRNVVIYMNKRQSFVFLTCESAQLLYGSVT